MTKSALLSGLLAVMLLGLAACAPATEGEPVQSEKPRITTPDVGASDLSRQVEGNSAFAFDLYQALRGEDGNLFYSPHSMSLALAMTHAGARGETERQMADTLHFVLSQEQLHPTLNALDLELSSRGEGAKGKDGEGFRLNIVNALWGQEGYEFLGPFLDVLAEDYGAGLRPLDFASSLEESRLAINDWVSDQTEARIEDLIPQGVLSPATVLVLTNAIYFNAAWHHPFEESVTRDGPFHLLDGETITVPMMRQTEGFGYVEGDGYQAVELPYDGRELSMVVLLPQEGRFEAFEGTLDYQRVADIIDALGHQQVALTMPRFTYESKFMMKKTLSGMGMLDAFLPGVADLSGINGGRSLFIDEVIHQAFVEVDEAGTEAAAATAVVVAESAAPAEPKEVTIDRPFIFLIRDIDTGAILFVGRVMDPSS
jgi:serpin B